MGTYTKHQIENKNIKKYVYFFVSQYAAEEAGLLGSQDIAAAYREEDKPIYGMFQLDMTGYTPLPPQPVRVIQDYVDAELSAFTEQLIDTYTSLERRTHSCGYGCSGMHTERVQFFFLNK